MAKDITLKTRNGETRYPKSVTALIYENGTGKTLQTIIDEMRQVDSATDTRTQHFKADVNNLDTLKNKTDIGLYNYVGTGWRGSVSVCYDSADNVSQVALSSSTPSYDGNTLTWISAQPCAMARTYRNGAWSHWEKVGAPVVNDLTTGGTDKALSAEMGKDLKSNIDALGPKIDGYVPQTMTIERGTLASGNNSSNNTRLRTSGYIVADTIRVEIGSSAKFFVAGYNDSGFVSNSNPLWITEATTISLDGCSKYRIVFAKSSDATITISDFATLGVKVFTYSENTKVALTKNDVVKTLGKGGQDKPLSAEAGKTIAAIADIVGGVEYEGIVDLTKQENFVWRDGKRVLVTGNYIGYLTDKEDSCAAVIDVSAYQGKTLTYSRKKVTGSSTQEGIIFFTGDYDGTVNKNNYIDGSGVLAIANASSEDEYVIDSVVIPENAGYVVADLWLTNKTGFIATVEALKTTEGLKKDVEDLQSNSLMKSDIVNDVEAGGAQKALSAEAGKTLNKEVKGSVKNYEEGSIYEYIANPNHGYKATCANGAVENDYFPVLPGDTVEWFHGATESDEDYGRIGLAFYNSSKSSIGSTSSNTENVKIYTFGSSSQVRFIRGSFLLARISECYIKINGVVVWAAKDAYTGHEQRITSLEQSNDNILSVLSNIGGGSGQIGITHDIPQTLGELYCIRKAKEQINVSSYLVGTIAAPTQTYNSGSYIVGIPYSSTRKYNTLVPLNVSFETYLTALTDPNSYAYTRTQGFGTYANLYYGAVCGSFMSYCLGIKVNRSKDWDMFGIPGMERVSVQSAQSMRIGYIINCAKNGTTHVMVCIGVTRNNGEVTSLTMAEGIHPVCREREYTASAFNSLLSKYTILKYNKLYENDYNPDATPFVMPFFNKNLMPAKGNKSNWLPTEDVEIDILNIGDYTNYVVYKDGAQYATASLGSATKINLGTLPYGSYSMVLTNSSNRSAAVKWIVVDVHMTVTALAGGIIRFSFSSANALPVGIGWGEYPDCYQNLVFDITKEDLQKGYKDTFLSTDPYTCDGVDGYEGQGSPYEKYHEYYTTGGHTIRPKMYFRTEFGTIATDWDMLGDITYVE